MREYFSNEFFLIALTFGSYFIGKLLRKRTGWVVMNPILVAIVVVISFLELSGVSYDTYNEGGHMIEFWLRPAVVALGVPTVISKAASAEQGEILKKLGEESTEIVIAAKNPDRDDLKFEISDFMYHCMILMAQKNITWEEIATELAQR